MTKEQVIAKFRRYAAPTVGRECAELFVEFLLEGSPSLPARRCFTLAGS